MFLGDAIMLISILAAAIILGLLILVHETGHFLVAKRSGVRVIRFSIGYPPKIWGFRKGETEYAIGATPLGGYVKMLGDEIGEEPNGPEVQSYLEEIAKDLVANATSRVRCPASKDGEEESLLCLADSLAPLSGPELDSQATALLGRRLQADEALLLGEIAAARSLSRAVASMAERRPSALVERLRRHAFPSQTLAKRFLIVLAGPFANIVFAPIVLALLFMYGLPRLLPVVGDVKKGMPAQVAGLRLGDHIFAINGKPIGTWEALSSAVKASAGATLRVEFERDDPAGRTRHVAMITPKRDDRKAAAGAAIWMIGIMPRGDSELHREAPVSAVTNAVFETGNMTVALISGIAKIVDGSTPVRQALGGPIMIAQLAGREAHEGFANVALFTVMLSLELGIINLLPIPMLDGGHLLFFVIEGLRGKPLQVRHREIAQQVGLFLLVVLMAFVIINDITRIVQG